MLHRYDRGGDTDYINCPMNKRSTRPYNALIGAETAELHSVDSDRQVYEGCMPIEIMAKRGPDTIRFGPMKPVGLRDPVPTQTVGCSAAQKGKCRGSLYNL